MSEPTQSTENAAAGPIASSVSDANIDQRLVAVGDDGFVSAEDVVFLRQNVFPDGVVSRSEILSIFALGERAPDGDRDWPQFFAEICADFFLNEEEPSGYITDGDFSALKALVTRDGPIASQLELGVLVRLLEKAVATPPAMSFFVADQLRSLVCTRTAPVITANDAALIRSFLYASGGAGTIGVTREEAELLFDLHDATADAENAAEWCDLFIKAIAAHIMQYVGYKPLPREEALRLHKWANDHSVNVGGFFQRMFSGGLSSIREGYGRKSITSERLERDEIGAEIAEMVTAREADWLADRIGRDGRVDDVERALIAYMKDLEADLPPKLQALVGDAA
ncbi:MAG: hypothetical protein AAF224_14620 [Pseudomonadota bacterium]